MNTLFCYQSGLRCFIGSQSFPSFIKLRSDLIIRAIITRRLNFKTKFKIKIEPKVLLLILSYIETRHVGSRPDLTRKPEARDLWINGPSLLQQYAAVPLEENEVPLGARRINLSGRSCIDGIDKLIESAPNLYTLQKRVAYLIAFPML